MKLIKICAYAFIVLSWITTCSIIWGTFSSENLWRMSVITIALYVVANIILVAYSVWFTSMIRSTLKSFRQ